MKERPILFTGPMVRALLEGRKTQTRRIVKPQWPSDVDEVSERPALDRILKCVVSGHSGEWEDGHGLDEVRRCPYGQPGDRLWVKETYIRGGNGKPVYCADTDPEELGRAWENGFRKTPSIFMRRWESRITLEVTAVRVERLQDTTKADAIAEGIERIRLGGHVGGQEAWRNYRFKTAHPRRGVTITDQEHRLLGYESPCASYTSLWESINGPGSWAANPWVWVIEFKGVSS